MHIEKQKSLSWLLERRFLKVWWRTQLHGQTCFLHASIDWVLNNSKTMKGTLLILQSCKCHTITRFLSQEWIIGVPLPPYLKLGVEDNPTPYDENVEMVKFPYASPFAVDASYGCYTS